MSPKKENNTMLFVALGTAAVLLVSAVVGMKFLVREPPPPPPPEIRASEVVVSLETPLLYKATLERDAHRYGVPLVTPEEIAQPLVRTVELGAPRTLHVGESIETPNLKISAAAVKSWAEGQGGGFRYEHLMLSITNRSGKTIAYRVDTQMEHPENCRSQGITPHNALAMLPGEKIERTECLFHPGVGVIVKRAETITLPQIGYYYISRLIPSQLGFDERGSAGHAEFVSQLFGSSAREQVCNLVWWRDVEVWGAGWADLIDFYARHNCETYSFYKGYRFRTRPGPLPAHPMPDGGN